jgi:hypothetical protein
LPVVPPAEGRAARLQAVARGLTEAGYTPAGLRAALGSSGPLVEGPTAGDRRRRARSAGRLGALARLFLLQDDFEPAELERALGELLPDLADLGLIFEEDGRISGSVLLVPHDDLLVASDRYGTSSVADQVPGVQGPSHFLGSLAIRRPVARALDLGTGCGIQSLLIAPYAERIIATDVNERALAFADLNLALNGVGNVELRTGSLFEPVAGERFGLILANPPYVISPDTRFLFRDSPLGGEGISEAVVRGLPGHLTEGGYATVLISWDASGGDGAGRPATWLDGTGCDGLILMTSLVDAEANAERWHVGSERDAGVERWIAFFRDGGIEQIAYGAVVVRNSGRGEVRALSAPDQLAGLATDQLLRLLDAPATLMPDDVVTITPGVELEAHHRFADGAWTDGACDIVQSDGFAFRAGLDDQAVAIVRQLTGTRSLADLGLGDDAIAFVHQLVSHGFASVRRSAADGR